jgi:D-beta-D-heptose 7-phosphate kinase/D-beta-D-heptose 1-phosphate adenosyltransferase
MKTSETIVVVSGGFDPIHSGHLRMFEAAKKLGDKLIVAVNSDDWLTRKKGRPFMPLEERYKIVQALHMVYEVELDYDDSDGSSVQALINIKKRYPTARIIFANGGDRTKENIPEMSVSGIEFKFGVGGEDKANSSSWILQEWKSPKTLRPWGYYRVLHENGKEVKVKELTVEPGQRLSMQRHKDRAEHWFVAEGTAEVYTVNRSTDYELMTDLEKFDSTHIANEAWHQLCNTGTTPLKIIEIQYGANCVEEDIERKG